jgi:hypothetical protein
MLAWIDRYLLLICGIALMGLGVLGIALGLVR